MFDTDCSPGSRCLKSAGALYGYCVGGIQPGNRYDNQPFDDPLDYTGKKGNTCSFNVDCGPGGQCVKSAGSIYGTCL